jgi:hypothetical protein
MVLMIALLTFTAASQPPVEYMMINNIEFQEGVTIDINLNIYSNENAVNWGDKGKIFAIEGMAHTANCWGNLAEELFNNPPPGVSINEFYAIDMPGKGLSGLPDGLIPGKEEAFRFEDLYIEDYLTIIRAVLQHLNDDGIQPEIIMGHSLAGAEVILLQQQLIDEGTNLRKAYGIKSAILLAPAVPASSDGLTCPWFYLDGGVAEANLPNFKYYSEELGWNLNFFNPPLLVWPFLFFTNPFYPAPTPPASPSPLVNIVPGAPFIPEVAARGYAGIEPLPLIYQLGGVAMDPEIFGEGYEPKPRPEVDPGIFKPQHGVQLTIIADEWDMLMRPDEVQCLYEMLTGDYQYKKFFTILGEHTCHDTHISDPTSLVEMLETPVFKDSELDIGSNLEQDFSAYPNPSTTTLNLEYSLNEAQPVQLILFNAMGKKVKEVTNSNHSSGVYKVQVSLEDLPAGIYFIKYTCGKEEQTKKITKID